MLAYKKQQALEALLVCSTRKEAAMMAGITEKTLREYTRDVEFQREYRAIFQRKMADATRKSQAKLSTVMQTFYDLSQNKDESAMVRIAAGRAFCEYALRLTEMTDIVATVEGEDSVL